MRFATPPRTLLCPDATRSPRSPSALIAPGGVGVDLYVETVAIRIAPVRAVNREVIGARLAQEVQVEVRLGRGDTPDVAERGESGSEKATRISVGYSQADRRVPMENGAGRLAVRVSGAVLEEAAPLLLAASD
jgi:hypothetical protein